MKDGLLRKGVKRVGLAVFHVRLLLHRSHVDVRFDLGGGCIRSGNCCEQPGIQVSKLTWYLPFMRRGFLWWHRHVNGFELAEASREQRAFLFTCTHFDRETRSCDSYESRPGMCRDYPMVQTERAHPAFLDGCGFRAVAKNRDELVQILEQQSLSPEQMAKLKKGLNLE